VTWPDLTAIPTTAKTMGAKVVDTVDLVAAAPTPDGWYAALLPRLPANISPARGSFQELPDGRSAVRVHVGSAPILWSVDVCPHESPAATVYVQFSEVVHAATTSTMPLVVSAGAAANPTACAPAIQPPLADSALASYQYECPARVGPQDVIAVSVGAGLLSESGAEVPATSRVAAFETLVPNAIVSGCSALVLGP
jgi:hypothetical protein